MKEEKNPPGLYRCGRGSRDGDATAFGSGGKVTGTPDASHVPTCIAAAPCAPRPPASKPASLLPSLESTLHEKRAAFTKRRRSMSLLVLKSRNGSLLHSQGEPRFVKRPLRPGDPRRPLRDACGAAEPAAGRPGRLPRWRARGRCRGGRRRGRVTARPRSTPWSSSVGNGYEGPKEGRGEASGRRGPARPSSSPAAAL